VALPASEIKELVKAAQAQLGRAARKHPLQDDDLVAIVAKQLLNGTSIKALLAIRRENKGMEFSKLRNKIDSDIFRRLEAELALGTEVALLAAGTAEIPFELEYFAKFSWVDSKLRGTINSYFSESVSCRQESP
jgi:hypothetical protein